LVARTLVTTADKRTWSKDESEPVLFLGEWCKRYSHKNLWESIDYEIVPYHWDDRKKLYKDYKYIENLYEKMLVNLSEKLNSIHDVNYELRYWRILIGPWLSFFIQILFDRWSMLNKAIEEHQISTFRSILRNENNIPANDYSQAKSMYINDDWNEMIFSQLFNKFLKNNITVEKLLVKFPEKKSNISHKPNKTIKSEIITFLKKCSGWFRNNEDYFFISTYLFLLTDLRLQLRLKQIPKIWEKISPPDFVLNMEMRQWHLNNNVNENSFERVVQLMIPLHIPMAYLEGYKEILDCVDDQPWPKKPKAIFTSNNHFGDDIFKAWVAKKTQDGTPLVIGQHGGHYGMTPFSFHEQHEISIADKWLSWGWSDSNRKQVVPFGNLPAINHVVKYNPKGSILMVEMNLPRYSYDLYAAPIAGQYRLYLKDQKSFINSLSKELTKKLIIRLSPNDYGRDLNEYWSKNFPEIQIDNGEKSITSLIRKSRLYVSTYNATTYLESLAWNIPTVIFWNPNYWELNQNASNLIKLLESAGIFHRTPESAVRHILKIWDDIPEWWDSSEVQEARTEFCKHYSYLPQKPLDKLESIFKEIIKS
jgi:putative transferase (TIGR04331 family)